MRRAALALALAVGACSPVAPAHNASASEAVACWENHSGVTECPNLQPLPEPLRESPETAGRDLIL